MDEPKPQTEVIEETRETLSILELDRTPRAQKLAAERAYFDGAHEVRFTLRTTRPRHGAPLDDIRAFVDSLEVRRREAPPLPDMPQPASVEVPPQVPDHYRAPLERVIEGALVSVETVHRVGMGTVVDVAWEGRDGGLTRALYVITDDEARPYTNVAAKVDELTHPDAAYRTTAPPEEAAPAKEEPAPEPKEKKLFGLGRKKDKPSSAPVDTSEKAPEKEKKRRFGFGKK